MAQHETNIPVVLYHYTSATGLLGILKHGAHSLWASAIGFSNDSSEGQYATALGSQILDDCQVLPDDPPAWKQLLSVTRDWFTTTKDIRESAYSVSFCEEDNVLSQWRAYGGVASFSIGLRNIQFDMKYPDQMNLQVVKICYNRQEQRELFLTNVAFAKRLVDKNSRLFKDISAPKGMDEQDFHYTIATECLQGSTALWADTVKHDAFAEEREWRLIATSNSELNQTDIQNDNVQIREYKGRLLPYISIVAKESSFDVASITIGPSKTQGLEEKAVKLILAKSGLNDVEIKLSDTPLQS